MSFQSTMKALAQQTMGVAYRPAQEYLVAFLGTGAYPIFNISGPVRVTALVGRITAAAVGATTIATTLNTIAGEAAAVACNGAVGTIVWVPLNVAGTLTNVAGQPMTDALLSPKGMIVGTQAAGPGVIVATYGIGTSLNMEWCVVYQKLSPTAVITVA
ncbi:MAG TPA: hypothetical protein VMV84_01195 [Dehalococcoidales bacterium]|nr:hypothetical protein [Dehalococcoidales bacterium]